MLDEKGQWEIGVNRFQAEFIFNCCEVVRDESIKDEYSEEEWNDLIDLQGKSHLAGVNLIVQEEIVSKRKGGE